MADIPVNESTAETVVVVTANGQTTFAFDFLIFAPEQMTVFLDRSGVETELAYPVDFSVSGLTEPNGGGITVNVSTAVGDVITMRRSTPIERTSDWQAEGDYKAALVNREQDTMFMIMQEISRDTGKAVHEVSLMDGRLTAEEQFRIAADAALGVRVDKETSDRTSAVSNEAFLRDAGDKAVASLIGQAGPIETQVYDSATAAALSVVKPTIGSIRTGGFTVAGDGGGALYRRDESEPPHEGKFQSADGAWWEIVARQRFTASMFGAVGDGVTNDSAALNRAVQVIHAIGGGTLLIENGTYFQGTTTFSVPATVNVAKEPGAVLVYEGDGVGMHVYSPTPGEPHRYGRWDVRIERPTFDWTTGADPSSVGVRFTNIREAHINAYKIDNFFVGLELEGNGTGSVNNTIIIGLIRNNKTGIGFLRTNVGWNNQNTYIGGAIRNDSATANVAGYPCTYIDLTENGNTFTGINMEGGVQLPSKIVRVTTGYNSFFACRYEAQGPGTFVIEPGVVGTMVMGGYQNYGPDAAIFDDQGESSVIIGARGAKFYGDTGVYGGAALNLHALTGNGALLLKTFGINGEVFVTLNGGGTMDFYDGAGMSPTRAPSIRINSANSSIDLGNPGGDPAPLPFLRGENATLVSILNKIVRWSSSARQAVQWAALADGASNVSLSSGVGFVTANTAATNISGFSGGTDGQVFYIKAGDAVTTILNNTNIQTRTGADMPLAVGQVVQFVATASGRACMV